MLKKTALTTQMTFQSHRCLESAEIASSNKLFHGFFTNEPSEEGKHRREQEVASLQSKPILNQ